MAVGCTTKETISGSSSLENQLRDEARIKDMVSSYLKAQHNIDYRTVEGNEGIACTTKRFKKDWFANNNDEQMVNAARKGRYVIKFDSVKWMQITIGEEQTATVEVILDVVVTSKGGKMVYDRYRDLYVVDLIKEDGVWKIDYCDSK